jgi:hypothetical protein
MSDATGFLVLFGVFASAGVFAIWNARLRSSARRRLAALGFEPCPGEEPALAAAWRELAAARGAPRDVHISGCTRRAAGWGMIHHFEVTDATPDDGARDRAHVPASWNAYLLDLRDPAAIHGAPLALYLLSGGSGWLRQLLRSLIALDAPGVELELGPHPWCSAIVAAFGAAPGKLDGLLPPAAQEKLARAAEHGFFCVKLANGKAAFELLGGRRDVEREWAYLSQWC